MWSGRRRHRSARIHSFRRRTVEVRDEPEMVGQPYPGGDGVDADARDAPDVPCARIVPEQHPVVSSLSGRFASACPHRVVHGVTGPPRVVPVTQRPDVGPGRGDRSLFRVRVAEVEVSDQYGGSRARQRLLAPHELRNASRRAFGETLEMNGADSQTLAEVRDQHTPSHVARKRRVGESDDWPAHEQQYAVPVGAQQRPNGVRHRVPRAHPGRAGGA